MKKRLLGTTLGLLFLFTANVDGTTPSLYKPVQEYDFNPVIISNFPDSTLKVANISQYHTKERSPSVPEKIKFRIEAVSSIKFIKPIPKPIKAPVITSNISSTGWKTVDSSSYGIGDGFLGKHMACGGPLTNTQFTVAYRYLHTSRAQLHCGDKIWLKYRNKGPILVTVTDAGPYAGNRIFDLAPATCRALSACGIPSIQWKKAI